MYQLLILLSLSMLILLTPSLQELPTRNFVRNHD